MAQKKRHVYGVASRRSGAKRQRVPVLRTVLLAALICAACTLRFSENDRLVQLRDSVATALQQKAEYLEAIEVFGRSAAEGKQKESAIAVFGKAILGLEKPAAEDAQEKDSVAAAEERAGEKNSGLTFVTASVAEAPLPEFIPAVDMSGMLQRDEMDDTTPDAPFEIPYPDEVEQGSYTVPFAYQTPLYGRVTSGFGYRIHPISGNTTFHHGADIAADTGTPIRCFADGRVCETGYSAVYGRYVKVQHDSDFLSFYAHLSKCCVKKGERVTMGEVIGKVGNTGYSTGPHLHFELRRAGKIVDPFMCLSFQKETL